jgi:multisubunit Na+/H+ antiporter MnhB subunit
MSGGLLGGLILALAAIAIAALRKRYPKATTIIIRTILGLIFAVLIGAVIYLLINPPK